MGRKRILIFILIILAGLLATLGSILINVATSQNLPIGKLSLPLLWFLIGIVTLAGICVAIFLHHLQSSSEQQKATPESQNRQRMLERVRIIWIKGVLEESLHGAALIALGLHEQRDAVDNPWRLVLQQMDRPTSLLPSGTRITQVYDNVGGELLILGEPGSGKTTILLELAHDLLERAKSDNMHPIPVVFNLSSWAVKRQPLTKWLVDELNVKYQVPRKIGQSWIDEDKILLLLDGLDEVTLDYREACMDAINTFRHDHGLVPIVLCSRSAEYLTQRKRIVLHSAVVVQPLTIQQIDDYLTSAGGKLVALQKVLSEDTVLQELATTPLMLSIMTLAYFETPVENIVMTDSPVTWRQQIFATYIQRMLTRRKMEKHYTPQKILYWLSWLAQQLKTRNQTEFYLERMQLDWLRENEHHLLYPIIVVGLILGLFIGIIYTFVSALTFGQSIKFEPLTGLICGLLIGLLNSFVYVLLNLVILVLSSKAETEMLSIEDSCALARVQRYLVKLLGNKFVYGVIIGVANGLLIGVLIAINKFFRGPYAGLVFGILNGMCVGLAYGILGKLNTEIQPAEILIWSWRSIRQNTLKSLGAGVLIGLFWGSFIALETKQIVSSLILGLILGLFVGSALLFNSGLSNDILDKRHIVTPNQGIKNSMRNGLIAGLANGIISGLIMGMIFGLSDRPYVGLVNGLGFGLAALVFFWLLKGGMAYILHTLLFLRLWYEGSIPRKYVHFLDFAAGRILLRKVGGGYIFIHRMLLEFFATSDSSLISDELVDKSGSDR